MREITLHIDDEILFDELLKNIKDNDMNILCNKTDKKYSLILANEDLNVFLYELSFYLVTQAFFKYTKNYSKEVRDKLEEKFFKSDYFYHIMLVELLNYFDVNKVLKENVFLNFNVRGFKEEVESMVKDLKMEDDLEELKEILLNHLKKKNIDLNDFKTLKADYINGAISFETVSGIKFNEMNFSDTFGINFNAVDDDKDCVAFSWFVCSFLDVEKVILSDNLISQKFIFELISILKEMRIELVME